jgi:hypothetical protein
LLRLNAHTISASATEMPQRSAICCAAMPFCASATASPYCGETLRAALSRLTFSLSAATSPRSSASSASMPVFSSCSPNCAGGCFQTGSGERGRAMRDRRMMMMPE